MSTYVRARTKRQIRHPASRCASHIRDKAAGEARRESVWIRVSAPERPSPERSWPLTGHEFRFDGEHWHRCEAPEDFADYLESEARSRSSFIDHTQRHGKSVRMKRPATGVEVLTTTAAPWVSAWTAHQFTLGAKQQDVARGKLAQLRNKFMASFCERMKGRRYVIGMAVHLDSSDWHIDGVISRQDGHGGRIGQGSGLRLSGPWQVGVYRQLRAGADIDGLKHAQFESNATNFQRRYGADAIPLDIQLARDFDDAATEAIGPELAPFIASYAASVPDLEREHRDASLASLRAAEAKITPTPTGGMEVSL